MAARTPSITRAVNRALRDTQNLDRDAGAVALVRRYAYLIDEAQTLAAELSKLRTDDDDLVVTLHRLRAKVDAQTVASDLGPKLLAALASLGMTPAARASSTKGGTPGVGNPAADALARLRAVRPRQ